MNKAGCIAIIIVLALSGSVLAQSPESIKGAVGASPTDMLGRVGGDLNMGQIDGDLFMTINLDFSMDFGKIGFGVRVPLRLRLMDNDPQNEESASVFRKEDWDEFSDYLKIIRYFRYGRKGEFIYLIVGDLPGASLGHGTIVSHYYNNIDLDHYKMGLVFDLNTDYGGVETMINHLFYPTLFGGRAYVRRWSFVDTESYMNNLAVGFTAVSDAVAPYSLVPGVDPGTFEMDGGYPKVDEKKAATIMGGDIEFRVLNTSWLTLTPYMDLNGILSGGIGYHAGILSVFHIPVISMDLSARIEYRYFTGDYIPAYFNSYYEIQKFAYPFKNETTGSETMLPKRQVLDMLAAQSDKKLNGYYAELVFKVNEWFTIGASYDDYDGPYNSNLRMYLDVPALEVVQFGCYYYKHNFEGASEAFTFDDKSLFLVEARYQITSFLYVLGQYWRIWQLDPESGEYESVDDWSVGLGASYNF